LLFVVDVGNTNIVLGIYQEKELLCHWRISTDRQRTSDEYGILIHNLFQHMNVDMKQISAVIISSVVPPLIVPLQRMCVRYFGGEPLIVGPGIKTGIRIHYENPRDVGADRIVNAIGAY